MTINNNTKSQHEYFKKYINNKYFIKLSKQHHEYLLKKSNNNLHTFFNCKKQNERGCEVED